MGTAHFLPWDHGNYPDGFLVILCAGIVQGNFMDPLYRQREKEAALPVSISVTRVFQNNTWTARKDECRLGMKGTHGEERKQRIWAFQTHISSPLRSKERQRPAVQAGTTRKHQLKTLAPMSPAGLLTLLLF